MKKCPYCAEEIQDDAIYCRWCKHDLIFQNIEFHQETIQEEKKKGKNGLLWFVLIVGVIVGYVLLSGKIPIQYKPTSSPINTTTPNVSLPYANTCMIQQQNIGLLISLSGNNIGNNCADYIGTNKGFIRTFHYPYGVTEICAYTFNGIRYSVNQTYGNDFSDLLCNWIGNQDSTQELSANLLFSEIRSIEGKPAALNIPSSSGNPITWKDLADFLASDHTNWNTYNPNSYVCMDFAIDLVENARKQNVKAWIVAVDFTNGAMGHAFVAFETSDKGIVYVEPQGDNTYSNVTIGNWLCDDWGQFECMGVIKSVEYFSECDHQQNCIKYSP